MMFLSKAPTETAHAEDSMMEQLFVLAGGRLEWQPQPDPEVFPAAVEIETRATAVSVGTETGFVRRWSKQTEGKRDIGYSGAGVVRRVGPAAGGGFAPGDRVACYGGPYTRHATRLAVPWTLASKIPANVPFEEAAFCGIGAICMHAVRRGEFHAGAKVVVYGMGILGQLEEQIARAWGCATMAVDRHAEHLDLAARCGCCNVFDTRDGDVVEAARSFAPDGVDGVIVNTGLQPPVMDQAAAMCRERGRIVMAGGGQITIDRTEVFAKELDLLISRAGGPGRYDEQYERQGQDLPAGFVRWSEGRNSAHFVHMIATGQVNMRALITHRYPYERAPEAFELLFSDRKYTTMGIVFEYPD
jgi:threonine dehydrogenase-like Zn-dependent dehydrogenase